MPVIELDEYLAIAAAVLGIDNPQVIVRIVRIPLAESALHAPTASFAGQDFYPDVIEKAGVLCSRLIRNHPLPDGNKRTAYLTMRDFLTLSGVEWNPPSEDERVAVIEALAAGTISEQEFIAWLRAHTG